MQFKMKAGVFAVAAAMASCASASHAARRHAHEAWHMGRNLLTTGSAPEPTCGCTTIYTTITGPATLIFPSSTYSAMAPPPTPANSTSIVLPVTSSTPAPTSTIVYPATVPTPLATTCPTPGVYTIPATTVTITESTTVCAATGTPITSGTYTSGGVTTTVTEATTVTCPYATTQTSEGVVTSTILTTTYVCPSAGTYTIAPLTTSCSTETFWVYPTAASYAPGTYTQAEVVTTITETDYVVFCPYTSPAPVVATSTYAPIVTYAPVETTPAVEASSTKTSSSKPTSSPSGELGTSGSQWAITYSPYQNSGACKAASDVMTDIADIASKGFSSVRVYSTDCSGLVNIGAACEAYGLKMIIGVFISDTGISGAAEQVTDIVAWGLWELVELVVLGNEVVFSGHATASELASFITECKSTFASAGYTGPCTTTEPLNVWQESVAELCAVVDVVGCNIHPFFNGDIVASEAGSFVASQLSIVDGLCDGKYGLNLETGWPSAGDCNGKACPGKYEQEEAVKSISEAVGGKSVMFSYVDDYWKEPGAFNCEQSWGAIQIFG